MDYYSNEQNIKEFNELRSKNSRDYVITRSVAFDFFKGVMFEEETNGIVEEAFSICKDLHLIIFNDGIKVIQKRAFDNHKSKSLFIPFSVEEIGKNALSSKTLEYIELPKHLGNAIIDNKWPLIDTYHFKDCSIVCEASQSNIRRATSQANFNKCWRSYRSNKITIALEDKSVDIDKIAFLVGADRLANCTLKIEYPVEEIILDNGPLFVGKILCSYNPNFKMVNGCLLNSKNEIMFMENKPFNQAIVVDPIVSSSSLLPAIRKGGKYGSLYTKFDISANSNFIEYFGIICNKAGCVVYIPDEKGDAYIFGAKDISLNALVDHSNLDRVIFCKEENKMFDQQSLINAIWTFNRCYYFAERTRKKPLTIVVPNEPQFNKIKPLRTNTLIIEIKDIESPDVVLE